MCRLAAYIGPDIRLDQFLLAPPHGLLAQARNLDETGGAVLHADGFGIGWYAADDAPAIYLNTLPIWSDANLPHLARSLYGDLWLATVRGADVPFGAGTTSAQPFCDDQLIFLHHGLVDEFSTSLRRTVRDFLEPHIEATMRGNTDSEHLFALLRHLLTDDAELSIEDALGEMFDLLGEWLAHRRALLNVLVSDGECIYAARHAINAQCPPLHYNLDDDAFPEGQLVATARLTEAEFWQPVPEHHLLTLDSREPPTLLAL